MYFKRIIEGRLKTNLGKGKVLVLYGARQVGKTTLIKHIIEPYGERARYIDCELLENKTLLTNKTGTELGALVANYQVVVFDEAQGIKGIGSVLKTLVDTFPNTQYIATGSSSFDLANEISEPLTGRSIEFTLFPLLLSEMANTSFDQRQHITSWMRFGSYPDIISLSENEKIIRLQTLVSQYLYKNVLALGGVKKPDTLVKLLKLLAFQVGNEVSYRELSGTLGVGQATVERYVDLLEKNFVIYQLGSYAKNLRNEITRGKKIYFFDLGVRNAIINAFADIALESRNDLGALFENLCVIERVKHFTTLNGYYPNAYFWRTYTQAEVDYLEETNGALSAFEFKWGSGGLKSKNKSALLDNYPKASLRVVTPDSLLTFIQS